MLCFVYTLYVIFSGLGLDPIGRTWNFKVAADLGNAFGPLNSIMAAIAAVSAIAAYLGQSRELEYLRSYSEDDKRASSKRDFESTFFNLIPMLRSTVKEIEAMNPLTLKNQKGRDAIRAILSRYDRIATHNGESLSSAYKKVYLTNRDDIAHYFRLFYHIVLFIDSSSIEDKKQYSRILRASLSSAEIVLIALNCMYGGGKEKLTPLVERYSLLHNISAFDADRYGIAAAFSAAAFGDRKLSKVGDISDEDFL